MISSLRCWDQPQVTTPSLSPTSGRHHRAFRWSAWRSQGCKLVLPPWPGAFICLLVVWRGCRPCEGGLRWKIKMSHPSVRLSVWALGYSHVLSLPSNFHGRCRRPFFLLGCEEFLRWTTLCDHRVNKQRLAPYARPKGKFWFVLVKLWMQCLSNLLQIQLLSCDEYLKFERENRIHFSPVTV